MSLAEKRLWIELVTTIGIWGAYFGHLVLWLDRGGVEDPEFAVAMGGHFFGALVLSILIRVVLSVLARRLTPAAERHVRDEREDLAALRAAWAGYALLGLLVFAVGGVGYIAGVSGHVDIAPISGAGFVVLANLTLGALIQSELLRMVVNILLLRRAG